jgi:membrane fusion protein (multidrug efflux system)
MKYYPNFPQSLNTVKRSTNVMKTIILLSTAIFLFGCSSEPMQVASTAPAPSLPVISITKSAETTYQEYPASVQGAIDLEIRPQVGGVLEQVLVNEGALVKSRTTFIQNQLASFYRATEQCQSKSTRRRSRCIKCAA